MSSSNGDTETPNSPNFNLKVNEIVLPMPSFQLETTSQNYLQVSPILQSRQNEWHENNEQESHWQTTNEVVEWQNNDNSTSQFFDTFSSY